PSLIDDRPSYLARLHRVLPLTDVVKASIEDLAWLEPSLTAELAAQRLLDRGPRIVLLTRGADGGRFDLETAHRHSTDSRPKSPGSANADQVHDEDQGLVRSDRPASATLAVGKH